MPDGQIDGWAREAGSRNRKILRLLTCDITRIVLLQQTYDTCPRVKTNLKTRATHHNCALQLSVQRKDLDRVKSAKLLGVHLNENLKWDEHVKHLASSCYGTLACLRKIKKFTPYKLRKHLAESLILSRLDFNDIIFYPLTERLINRLQSVQYSATSFVTDKYVNSVDALFKLGWLPVRERTQGLTSFKSRA